MIVTLIILICIFLGLIIVVSYKKISYKFPSPSFNFFRLVRYNQLQFFNVAIKILTICLVVTLVFLFGELFFKKESKAVTPQSNSSNTFIYNDSTRFNDSFNLELHKLKIELQKNTDAISRIEKLLNGRKNITTYNIIKFSIWLILSGIFFFLAVKFYKKRRVLSAIWTLGTIFSIQKFADSIFDNQFSLLPESNIIFYQKNIQSPTPNNQINDTLQKIDFYKFGPFKEGFDEVEKDSFAIMYKKLQNDLQEKGKKYKELIIVGGVDIRQPVRLSRGIYGDNLSLSQARANYVKKLIAEIVPYLKEDNLIVITGGATNIYINYDCIRHQENRIVHIYAKK